MPRTPSFLAAATFSMLIGSPLVAAEPSLHEVMDAAPLVHIKISGVLATPRGDRPEERTYSALHLQDGTYALVSGLGRWQARFGGVGAAELQRSARETPQLKWRVGWSVAYDEFALLTEDSASEAVPLHFLGIDQVTGLIFLAPSAEHLVEDVAVMPQLELGQSVVVVDVLPDELGASRTASRRSVAALATYERGQVDVAVLAGDNDDYGIALAADGSVLGLLAAVAGRQVIFDHADLSVLRRQAQEAWQVAEPVAAAENAVDGF